MAYSLVSAGTAATGTTSVSPTFGATTTANNLLIAWLVFFDNVNSPATPSGWTRDVFVLGPSIAIYSKVAAGSDTAPTFSDATAVAMAACLAEFSGNATSTPKDQSGTGTGTTSPVVATAGGNDSAAAELMIVIQLDSYTKSGTVTTTHTYTDSGGSHPAAQAIANNDSTSTAFHWRFSYAIGSSASVTGADSVSCTDNSMNLQGINPGIASYKLAATSTAVAIKAIIVRQAMNRSASF